mmetsp:Transcript_2270/g.5061  ORF Transcript_2270/g.5061 Transcript_2270/m.5061 type:complete len:94 (+) Transcript_2270:1-282(+)
MGSWVRTLQEGEKKKLQLTIALQVERKRAKQMREQRAERAGALPEAVAEELQEEEEFVEEIQDNKLKWLNDQVGEVVGAINEALDEIRYWETE